MNSRIVTPPHRIIRLAKVAPVRFFITYFTGGPCAPDATASTAAATCTTRHTIRTTRMIQSSPAYGRIGVAERAQVVGVLVERVLASERLEVAVHVQSARSR